MPRIALFLPALLLGAVIGCKDQYGNLAPSLTASPVSAGCAANPTVTAFDDTTLRAALKAARPADVIAVSGTIEVTADDTIATDNVTLTCATPGSGLVARGLEVVDMITVLARGVVVDGLVLDGSRASDAPWFAFNDGQTAFAQDVRFTNNTVTCTLFGACAFVVGGTGAVVSDNQIQRNQIRGAVVDGIRTASCGGVLRGAAENLFARDEVSGAGRAGIFADRACSNQFASNDLRGNAGDLGLFLTDATGVNVVAGVNNAVVIDNGAFDCDGDGRLDPNIITGGVTHHQPAPPDTSSATQPRRQGNPQPL